MLKIRVEGKEKDIKMFLNDIHCNESIEVNSISNLYPNRKNVYSRCYLEIEFNGEKDETELVDSWESTK